MYLRTLGALLLTALVALPAHAATAALSVRSMDENVIHVRYEGLAKTDSLSITDAKGNVVKQASVSKSRGTKDIRLPETAREGVYTVRALARDGGERTATAFTYDIPAPTCSLHVSDKSPQKRDTITLRWKSENALYGYIFGNRKVEGNGSERVAMYNVGKRGFSYNVIGAGGIGGCSVVVNVSE